MCKFQTRQRQSNVPNLKQCSTCGLVTHSCGTLFTSYKLFLAERSSEKVTSLKIALRETICKKLKVFHQCVSSFRSHREGEKVCVCMCVCVCERERERERERVKEGESLRESERIRERAREFYRRREGDIESVRKAEREI